MDSVLVSEICSSIMGESPFQGYPCVILRLAGCNLKCRYCDTPYAMEARLSRDRHLTVDQIVEEVLESGLPLVLLTGGEPMSQGSTPALIRGLLSRDCRVVLETNGAFDLSIIPEEVFKVVDVKCPGSGESGSFLLSNLSALGSRDWLKFVLSDRHDYRWTLDFLETRGIGGEKGVDTDGGRPGILFSPVHGKLSPADLAAWMLEDRVSARLNLQIHKYIGVP